MKYVLTETETCEAFWDYLKKKGKLQDLKDKTLYTVDAKLVRTADVYEMYVLVVEGGPDGE